jgi:hypothetical protein
MSKEIIYASAPKGVSESIIDGKILADFLPPPELLVRKSPREAVAITATGKRKRNPAIRKSLYRESAQS